MKIPKIKLSKRVIIPIGAAVVSAGLLLVLVVPLFGKVQKLSGEYKMLDEEMALARDAIKMRDPSREVGQLLTRREVSRAIDEITKLGAEFSISFLSTNPQPITRPQGGKYPILPIEMEVQSEYRDLGLFLGALEKLKQSVVTVRSFQIETDQGIMPQVRTDLVVEVYLREGQDG